MRLLASVRVRLFLACWILYSVHFATNVVREHYPAFSLAEQGTLRVDDYHGLHPDIFRHTDGHSYINNQVGTSVVAALPLFLFDPILDHLEERGRRRAEAGAVDSTYRSPYPLRRRFFQAVRERGLDLRFGGATAITSVGLMAPLSAWLVVLLYGALRRRDVSRARAVGLALLFAFGTPLFFRTAHLNQNVMVTYAAFGSFLLLWGAPTGTRGGPTSPPLAPARLLGAGLLAGLCLVFDYSGVVCIVALFLYLMGRALPLGGWRRAVAATLPFVAGSLPAVGFLLFTQWWMFGNPFLPSQFWMTAATYTSEGFRGLSLPQFDLFLRNLFDPAYGLVVFAPLAVVGALPWALPATAPRVMGRVERGFTWAFALLFLTFCSANQYARMQFNTGFRYLLPLVPFLFLVSCNVLACLPRVWLVAVAVPSVALSWAVAMVRESVPESLAMVAREGVQLPWLKVLRQTSPDGVLPGDPFLPAALVAVCALVVALLWRLGGHAERRARGAHG